MSRVQCVRCGTEVDEANSYIEFDGEVCLRCFDAQTLTESYRKAIRSTAYTSLAMASAGFLAPIMALPGFFRLGLGGLAVASAAACFRYWGAKDKKIIQARQEQFTSLIVASLGALLGLIDATLFFLPFFLR